MHDTLQWRPHYDNITAKAYKILSLLHRILKPPYPLKLKNCNYIDLLDLAYYTVCLCGSAIFNLRYSIAGKVQQQATSY